MSIMHAVRRVFPSANTADGTGAEALDASRYGELFRGPDFLQRRVMGGYGFRVTVGALSTGITGGGAGTVVDLDQPEVSLSIPAGTILVPLSFSAQVHVPLIAADADEVEILFALDRASANAGDGTATTESIFNMRTDKAATGSLVTAKSAYTADTTDPVLDIELARAVLTADVNGVAANALTSELRLDFTPRVPDFIVGPACVYVYWGGTVATPGFAQLSWVEFPAAYANG